MNEPNKNQRPQVPTDKPSKKYTFAKDEYLYISEQRSFMELHDSLIRRYIASKVLPRVGISTKEKFIKVSDDGNGIDVYDLPKSEPAPIEVAKK